MEIESFVLVFLGTIPFYYVYDTFFLQWNERRADKVQLSDAILAVLPRVNTSLWISMLSVGEVFVFGYTVLSVDESPWTTLTLFWVSFTYMHMLRMLCIWLCPLHAPVDGLVLRDTLVELVLPHSTPLRHDMFFSGHVALNVLFEVYSPVEVQWVFRVGTVVMTVCLLLGAYHYTIDILIGGVMAVYSVHTIEYVFNQM